MTADEVISLLELEPLPGEGGMFAQHYADRHSTAIYFLVRPGDFSALHRLSGTEIYHFYAGAPLQMLLLYPDGEVERFVLGNDLAAGQRPALAVPPGVWQGARTTGDWSLVGTTMAPGFKEEMFELGDREGLLVTFPSAAADIDLLTR
ncbi:MAG TPA: cupin domain-containing protein [Acidimicrobiia bacterium]|nr:cupin domain-containing protein [Acidimicrobiia bacterium]